MRLAEELVGIAHQLLLDAQRQQVAVWQWQVALDNLVERQPRPSVPLAHQRMAKEPYLVEHAAPYHSVANVGLGAMAVDARRIGVDYTYVVKHSSLDGKLQIQRLALRHEPLAQLLHQLRHLATVQEQQLA